MKAKLSTLQAKADKLASIYIRMKYEDHAGRVTCITCGKSMRWQDAHNAHYVERRYMATRYVEKNLHPACAGCNMFNKEFHKRQYTIFMLDTYGREFVDELIALGKRVLKPSEKRQICEDAIADYTERMKQ